MRPDLFLYFYLVSKEKEGGYVIYLYIWCIGYYKWCEMELGTYQLGGGSLPLGGSCLDESPEWTNDAMVFGPFIWICKAPMSHHS